MLQVAGDQAGQFEAWYKKIDPSGAGAIQAGSAAGFLKKSGLNDNVLSRVSLTLNNMIILLNYYLLNTFPSNYIKYIYVYI